LQKAKLFNKNNLTNDNIQYQLEMIKEKAENKEIRLKELRVKNFLIKRILI